MCFGLSEYRTFGLSDRHRLTAGRWFSPGNSVSSTKKTYHNGITEILFKVAIGTMNLNETLLFCLFFVCFLFCFCFCFFLSSVYLLNSYAISVYALISFSFPCLITWQKLSMFSVVFPKLTWRMFKIFLVFVLLVCRFLHFLSAFCINMIKFFFSKHILTRHVLFCPT